LGVGFCFYHLGFYLFWWGVGKPKGVSPPPPMVQQPVVGQGLILSRLHDHIQARHTQ